MGARKRISAEARKEAQKTMYYAKLNNVPTSPRKMRLRTGSKKMSVRQKRESCAFLQSM